MLRPIFDQTTDRSVKNRRKKRTEGIYIGKNRTGPDRLENIGGKVDSRKVAFSL